MKKILTSAFTILLGIYSHSQEFTLELFVEGLSTPVELTHAGDERLFVVEKGGSIKIVNPDGSVNPTPFLNISSLVSNGSEQGLLGLAFPPDYQTTGRFYVNYTNTSGNTVIARYTVSEDPNIANPDGTILLTINQPYTNHNGGSLHFGPDGYLWISTGDGGSGGDPQGNGQNTNTLLGKMLRIDVSGDSYSIPPDNPFVGSDGRDEIWAYGLRNAWKFSFDRETNEVWIADVGQNQIEEINKRPANQAGLNYGWRCYEGNNSYNTSGCAAPETMEFPIATYNHSSGRCSITGGYVYRGTQYPNLIGKYFFADYCSGEIGWVDENGTLEFLTDTNYFIYSFGEDLNGQLYVVGSNRIFKIKGQEMGVSDPDKLQLTISPNPVTHYLNISSNKNIDQINLYTLDGKLLKTWNGNQNKIDLSSYSQGIYLVIIQSENITKTQKIIKN